MSTDYQEKNHHLESNSTDDIAAETDRKSAAYINILAM